MTHRRLTLMALALGALAAVAASSPTPNAEASAPASRSNYPTNAYLHANFPDIWEVLARHDALEADHQMARKSVRSPSRRLRFGRRSDPMMAPAMPSEELRAFENEVYPPRALRAPVRMRFGRRSPEQAVPHIFPPSMDRFNEDSSRKFIRAPTMRLRFGRRSDNFMAPYVQAERDYRTTHDETEVGGEE